MSTLTAPFTADLSDRFTFGNQRGPESIQGVCVHTTENSDVAYATGVAEYQILTQSGSYHVIVDSHGQIVRCNTDDWVTWSSGNKGNNVLLHIAVVGHAAWSRAEWLRHDIALAAVAKYLAYWSRRYGIPLVKITPDQLKAGVRGVVGHVDTGRAWGGTDHTDPGPDFPYGDVLAMAHAFKVGGVVGKPAPTSKDKDMTPEQARQLREVWDQLCGPQGKGWPQLGGKTLVDSLVDAHRKLDTIITHLDNA